MGGNLLFKYITITQYPDWKERYLMEKYLVIAEKPATARNIAAVLGANEKKDGYLQGGGYIVSWCVGHLVGLAQADAYDEKYAKWRYADLPVIPSVWKRVAAKDRAAQLKTLAALMKSAEVDTVINACDAGREGELIFRLAYEYCGCKKPIQRLWISSMEDAAIKAGFDNLRPGADYDNLYAAALCREKADWLVGINATRLFSVLYRQTLGVGRVQSPTLALLVEREKAIAAFVKEPFYTPELDCGAFTVSGEKLKDSAVADAIRAACDGKTAAAVSVKRQEKSAAPPKLYDLTTLQREANRLYGYTAQQTLDYVQALYEKALSTYPRTDSRFLTEDMAAGLPVLVNQAVFIVPGVRGGEAIVCNTEQVIDNARVTDHHAIIPTIKIQDADLAALPAGERDILLMLAARLVCAVGEKHTYAETVVTLDCEGHSFTAKGKAVLRGGWKAVEDAYRASLKNKPETEDGEEDKTLPDITEKQAFENVCASVKEGFTSPPKSYTEDTLLKAMETAGAEVMPDDAERKGLGTPATRAGIIEKLVKTGTVERRKKQLIPTEKGVNLIAVLPDVIKSPMLTAEWESRLKEIERGALPGDGFMDGIAAMTRELVAAHDAPNPEYLPLFALPMRGDVIGVCPRCGGAVYEGKRGFYCADRACSFMLWRDNRFWASKKKEITKTVAAALLKEGRVSMTGLYSEKSGKSYDAVVVMEPGEKGGKYVNFKLEFSNDKKGAKK